MAAEDIRYDCYGAHRETISFEEITLYSGWLASSSTIVVRYLLKRVTRPFGFEQTIPRDPSVSAPIAMACMQLEEVFADWEHHMVPEEAWATPSEHDWGCVERYISWYYRVSHPYMLPDAEGGPSRPAHEEILRAHQAQLDHTQDLLPLYRQITNRGL
ncbi:uncharacterized protein LOC131596833 [Vicia villosa]|uniref:uncharacterized protein LOC131596833 n=1 Tax=Vicia villosa TaxID=3911 RepID=UPI00273CE196|nr:uncharacterized protein LOC131596833 [Vicia villosa]